MPGRGKESGGPIDATGSGGWQADGATSSITTRGPAQRRALGERAASQTCQQAKRQGPKFLVDQTPRSPNHDPAFSADSHTCNEASGQQGSRAAWQRGKKAIIHAAGQSSDEDTKETGQADVETVQRSAMQTGKRASGQLVGRTSSQMVLSTLRRSTAFGKFLNEDEYLGILATTTGATCLTSAQPYV